MKDGFSQNTGEFISRELCISSYKTTILARKADTISKYIESNDEHKNSMF